MSLRRLGMCTVLVLTLAIAGCSPHAPLPSDTPTAAATSSPTPAATPTPLPPSTPEASLAASDRRACATYMIDVVSEASAKVISTWLDGVEQNPDSAEILAYLSEAANQELQALLAAPPGCVTAKAVELGTKAYRYMVDDTAAGFSAKLARSYYDQFEAAVGQ